MTNHEEVDIPLSFRAKSRDPVIESLKTVPCDPSTTLGFAQNDFALVTRASLRRRRSSFRFRDFS